MKERKITKKAKRRLTFLSFAILFLVGIIVASVFNDLCEIIHNKSDITLLNSQYEELLRDSESLQSEITKLQDSDYVARYAREKYMYSLPDEVIIKLPDTSKE